MKPVPVLMVSKVKWNGPFVGQVLGSVGEDGYCRLWEEDLSYAPNSGRRFKQIMTPLASKTQLPWVSLDFKNINTESYLALITRDGELSVMEPKDHDMLSNEWSDCCLLYTSPSPRDGLLSRMPSSA